MSKTIHIQKYIKIEPGSCIIDGNEELKSDNIEFADFIRFLYKQNKSAYPKFFKMDKLSKLGFVAAEYLLSDFDRNAIKDENIAMIIANAESTMHTDETFYDSVSTVPSPAVFVYTLPNIMMGEIAIRHMVKGENTFFISSQFDATLLQNQVQLLFDQTNTEVCLCGWVNYKNETDYTAYLSLINLFGSNDKSIIFTTQNFEHLLKKKA